MLKHAAKIISGLSVPDPVPDFTDHAYPKSPSPIVIEEGGRRRVEMQRWGMGHVVEGKPKLVTNARDDRLKIALWRDAVAKRRCLIPVVGYFEPGIGPPGAMGELLFTLKDRPVFFIAGLWGTDLNGARAYAMVTTTPNAYTAPFHDRQPVALTDEAALEWLGSTPLTAERLVALTRPPTSEVMQHAVIAAKPPAAKKEPGNRPEDGQGSLF